MFHRIFAAILTSSLLFAPLPTIAKKHHAVTTAPVTTGSLQRIERRYHG